MPEEEATELEQALTAGAPASVAAATSDATSDATAEGSGTDEETPAGTETEQSTESFLTAKEQEELVGKSVEEIKTGYQRAYTAKTMDLAKRQKNAERSETDFKEQSLKLQPAMDLIRAYSDDPTGTIRKMAAHHQMGAKDFLVEGDESGGVGSGASNGDDPLLESTKQSLGKDFEFLAPSLLSTVKQIAGQLLDSELPKRLGPLEEQQKELISSAASTRISNEANKVRREFPDFDSHSKAITDLLMQNVQIMGGDFNKVNADILRGLYHQVTRSGLASRTAREVIDRQAQAVSNSKPTPSQQSKTPASDKKDLSFRDSFLESIRERKADVPDVARIHGI